LRALRANHVFGTDEKRIRTENMVMVKSWSSAGGSADRRLHANRNSAAKHRNPATTAAAI
jgi:hypothetical protein